MRPERMMQGQLTGETELRIIREDGHHFDSAKYVLAGGFQIVATRYGVTFAGSCTSLTVAQVKRLKIYISRASKIAEELAEGRGLMPEAEFSDLRLRGRRMGELHVAWYEGRYSEREEHTNPQVAVKRLRLKNVSTTS